MNCLQTELDGVVNNNEYEYLVYLHFNVQSVSTPNANDFSIYVQTTAVTEMHTTTGGHFTDSSLTENRGTTANTNSNQKFSNGNYSVLLPLQNVVKFKNGASLIAYVNAWQVNGFNYKRLFEINSATLTEVDFKSEEDLNGVVEYTANIVKFGIAPKQTFPNLDRIIQTIITQSTRTTDFFINAKAKDHYSPGGGVLERNVHYISSSAYSVYNSADTTKLYDAEKINGVWTYTNA